MGDKHHTLELSTSVHGDAPNKPKNPKQNPLNSVQSSPPLISLLVAQLQRIFKITMK
ncbi:hypothetical protein JT103_03415 [Helicobacter pylori]|nr:hypothetical protein [Helicobacter pylori]